MHRLTSDCSPKPSLKHMLDTSGYTFRNAYVAALSIDPSIRRMSSVKDHDLILTNDA